MTVFTYMAINGAFLKLSLILLLFCASQWWPVVIGSAAKIQKSSAEEAKKSANIGKTEKIKSEISVDLLEASRREVQYLLKSVNAELYGDDVLQNAVRRYETCWLPLKAKNSDFTLVPPEDVELIWHAHMLAPAQYREDSAAITGTVVDHQHEHPASQNNLKTVQMSIQAWNSQCPEESYDFRKISSNSERKYLRRSSYDLVAAVKRQHKFAAKVSGLAIFSDPAFISNTVGRYIKFLELIQAHKDMAFVPTLDIDLVWHTHQLHPEAYYQDCLKLMGYLIDHNDAVDGHSIKDEFSNVERLWMDHFNEPYKLEGEFQVAGVCGSCGACDGNCMKNRRKDKIKANAADQNLADCKTNPDQRIAAACKTNPDQGIAAACKTNPDQSIAAYKTNPDQRIAAACKTNPDKSIAVSKKNKS